MKKFNEVKDIDIIRKGIVRRDHDTSKYYIRIIFNDNSHFDFGSSVSFFTNEIKYRKCVAMLKGVIIPEVLTPDCVTDETVDETKYR